jgi:hypothetical protein
VWLSGAQPLSGLKWELWKPGSRGGMSAPLVDESDADGCAKGHGHPAPMGTPGCGCEAMTDAVACAAACEAADNCTSYTYVHVYRVWCVCAWCVSCFVC